MQPRNSHTDSNKSADENVQDKDDEDIEEEEDKK